MFFAQSSTKSLRGKVGRWVHGRFRPAQRSSNVYRGVYASFDQARAAIGNAAGYDSEAGSQLYRDRIGTVLPEDYAVLFHLRPLVASVKSVYDFGGHIGLHFHAFRTKLELPPTLQWTVSDLPAVTREGESIARSRGLDTQLHFKNGWDGLDGSDVCLSSGALQYLEAGALHTALAACSKPPKHVLLNKLPVRDGASFVTVQDVWVFKAPYTVFGRSELIVQMQSLGYALKDSWGNPGHHCMLLGDAEHSVPEYSGFYFARP